ncbi:Sugar kinase of the NBD/HSP70 family, may contain an N-terminal HTH domain [Mesorhizobium albiziae]|uniref:Sugar kinase of the NBD/HSP70 family, may contain an N-terminal HTH domain n=1 Tax=Neomesorhizobium albiziae TaxID=335020 RepID=A0A1I4DZU6_9HYPH|nr:ROK family transcriptional regulator [Mesorhizobium albiziae]GLS31220.1 sugar kinase [Mesorhizobium albiziae]SFK99118.1 Sugar kinase of the NBD/HSP70 family, may contain an N-terminal HTH domain [Mesorhizobium albiziae]
MKSKKSIAGTNLEQAKSHNRRVVIEAVRTNGALSRAAIARLTALSSQTVSNIVEELQAAEILRPEASLKGARGQPAVPYSIDPRGAYSIGLQLDHQLLLGAITDLSGAVRARVERKVDRPTPAQAMPVFASAVDELMSTFRFDRSRLLGIGLSMPGPFNVEGMTSVGPTALPGWQDFPVASELEALTGISVTVENDATAAAIGERLHGVARNLDSFVYLFIGTGLGAGLFLNGHLYKGSGHNAGEIGHVVVQPGGLECGCGKRGCLERYVSLRAVFEFLDLPDPDHASPDILEELLARNDSRIEAWLAAAADPLRQAINILELTLDPDAVVLGGFMPVSLIELLAKRIDPLPISVSATRERTVPRVLVGAAGKETSVLGAAALPIFAEINPQFDVLLKPHS